MIKDLICQRCGATYQGDHRSRYCPYCKEHPLPRVRIGDTKICPNCGKEFELEKSSQKYCAECGPIVARKKRIITNNRYGKKTYGRLELRVLKDDKQHLVDHAAKMGESVNQFILRAVKNQIEIDNKSK